MLVQSARLRVLLSAVVLALAHVANAQDIASNFDQLRVLVRPGDTLTFTDEAGNEFKGRLLELSSSLLAVRTGNKRRELTVDEIQRITRPQHGDAGTGALWGAGVGAGFGMLMISTQFPSGRCSDCAGYLFSSGLVFGGIGAGLGAAFAAGSTHQQLVFNKAGTPLKLTVAPLVTRERQGVLASLRF
jgi:hypothetical protein